MMDNLYPFNHHTSKQRFWLGCTVLATLLLLNAEPAFAGKGGAAFDTVWTTLKDWVQGTLGRVIALTMIGVGIIAGIARQSLIAFAIGIAAGIGLYNAPVIVEAIMTATLPLLDSAEYGLTTLSNGLN